MTIGRHRINFPHAWVLLPAFLIVWFALAISDAVLIWQFLMRGGQ